MSASRVDARDILEVLGLDEAPRSRRRVRLALRRCDGCQVLLLQISMRRWAKQRSPNAPFLDESREPSPWRHEIQELRLLRGTARDKKTFFTVRPYAQIRPKCELFEQTVCL